MGLGKMYVDGEVIVKEGDIGNVMYVVQQGTVDVYVDGSEGEVHLSSIGPGESFGEMALFTQSPRSATVRAKGEARVLTIDKRGFFKRVQQDPSLAFRILQKLSERIEHLNKEVVKLSDTSAHIA